ncbi:uncharacterized protein LOC121406223 [Lytechinus variegatus]|uniref:uncharacterized protein LOC121406223 n=1 Tax=Lytechinus variegatus TaxID=7654 RepID=UPI001BB23D20|nr:uncharacterized protein LOC121406223 [Lytechinus variegatus]
MARLSLKWSLCPVEQTLSRLPGGVSPDYNTTYSINPDDGAELDLDREENGLLTYRGLQPASEYTIFVTYNDSMNTQVNVSTFTEPLQPADFKVISASYQEIVLSWSPGGGQTSMYEITLTTDACGGYTISNEITNPNATLGDLRIATSFVITVVAVVDGTKSAPGSITVATDDTDVVENAVSVLSASTLNDRDVQLTVAILSDSPFTATVDSTPFSGSCSQSSIEEVTVNTGTNITLNITISDGTFPSNYRTDPGILQNVGVESITSTSAVVGFSAPLRGSYDGAVLILTSLQDEDYYPPGQEWKVSSPDTNFTLEDLKPSTSYNVSAKAFLLSIDGFEEQFSLEEIETFNTLALPASEISILEMGDDSVTLIHGGQSATFNFSVSPEIDSISPREGNRVDLTGLQPGVTYSFSVNVIDESKEASILLRLPPARPLVSVGATTETSITLNIDTSSGTADTYAIKIASTNPEFCLFEDERSQEFLESVDHVIDYLPPGLEYTIEVTGVVAAITDDGGVVLEMTSGPEANVSGSTDSVRRGEFLVIDEGEANITLAWYSNTTSNLTVTDMTRAQSMTDFILSETDCSSPRVMDFELSDPGTVYTIAYSAISGEEFEYRIRTDPGDLENFRISHTNQTSIELYRELPLVGDVDRVDVTIVSQVDRRYNSPGQTISINNIQASYLLDDLLPSILYEFFIRTVLNATDEFEEQQSGSLKDVASTSSPAPGTIYEIDRNETSIFYTLPSFTSIDVDLSPIGEWETSDENNRVYITNLIPGQLYNGSIDISSEELMVRFRLRPSQPVVTILDFAESNITLELKPGLGVLDEYIITIACRDATQNDCDCEDEYRVEGDSETFILSDLRPGVEYDIRVMAWGGPELDERSEPVILENMTTSIPGDGFTVLDQTPDSVFLAWTASEPTNVTMERMMEGSYVHNATFPYRGCFSSYTLMVEDLEPVTLYRFTSTGGDTILIRTDPPSIANCSVKTSSSSYVFTWSALPSGRTDDYQVTVTDSSGQIVQEETVSPEDDLEVMQVQVEPETNLTLVVNSRLAADGDFPEQFGPVPCMVEAVTRPLVPGELSTGNETSDGIPFTVGNASMIPGFEDYSFTIEPPGPTLSFDADSLMGVFSDITPGQLYTITSNVEGTDMSFTSRHRAKPLSPVNSTSPVATVTTVRLEWIIPNGIVTFYRVSINPTFETEENFIDIEDLLPGTHYNVSIVAVSGTGLYQQISDPLELEVITSEIPAGEMVFVDVTSLSVTAIFDTTGVIGSVLVRITNSGGGFLPSIYPSGNMFTLDESYIQPSQIYNFMVFDLADASDTFAEGSVRSNPEIPQPPRPASVGSFSLSFEWDATVTPLSSYRVYYVPFSFRREQVSTIPSNSTDLTYRQECLRPDTEYVFELLTVLDAADGFGEQTSNSAQSITITTAMYPNNEPHISSNTNTTLTLTWIDAATDADQVCLKELCSTLRSAMPVCQQTNQTCPIFYHFEDLVPGRRYVVYVENNDGTMEDIIFTQTKPNPPEFLNATALDSNKIQVYLVPPEGEFDGYELSFSPSNVSPISLEPETSVYVLDNLQADTEYTINVLAFSGHNGQRLEGDVISATTTTEQMILDATNIATDGFFVTWSSAMLALTPTDRFQLSYFSMVNNSETVPRDSSEVYIHPIGNLVPGDLVTVSLSTVTSGGQATLIDTLVRRTKPEEVSSFTATRDSPTSIRLLWRAPPTGLYWGYLVWYTPSDGDQSSPIELGQDEEELTITGLAFDQMYNVSIRSFAGRGGSYRESDPVMDMVSTGMGEANEVNIRTLTPTSVSFTWAGSGSGNFIVSLSPVGSCMADTPANEDVASREATFNDLVPGARYAIERDGSPLTIDDENAEFIAVPDQVSNVQVKFINSSAVTLTWTPPSGCYDRIEISYSPDTCTNPSPIVLSREDGNEHTLTPLGADVEYELSFITLQMTARSEPYLATVRTTCPEKEKLNVGSVQADSISLTWGETTDPSATGYTLVATPESSTPIVQALPLSVSEHTFSGLMSGVDYTILLYVNGTSITDTITQTTCPSEARNVSVIFFTQTCLTFVWLPPEGNFNSYEVFVRHGNPPVFVFERTVNPDEDLNILVENLNAGTLYTIGVVTVVNGFMGKPALTTQRTIDDLVMTSSVVDDLQAVRVSWEPHVDAAYYNLVYIPDNGNVTSEDLTNISDTSVTIGNLTPGKRYVFILSLYNMDNESSLLAQTSYTLKPESPILRIIEPSATTAELSFVPTVGVYETYEIKVRPSGPTLIGDRAAVGRRFISGLTPNTNYTATVTLRTGDEEFEDDIDFTTDALEENSLYVADRTTTSVRLVWIENPAKALYAIQLFRGGSIFVRGDSFERSDLEPGTEYNPILYFMDPGNDDFTTADDSLVFTTQPEPVLFFEVKEVGETNITFVWSGPPTAFHAYLLYITPDVEKRLGTDETEITVELDVNTEYLATIYTIVESTSTTLSEPATLNVIIDPREPGAIQVTEVTSTSISITWTEIAGITDYIVNLTLASNNSLLFSRISRDSREASFSGLSPGEEYVIKIGLQCAGEVLSLRQFTRPFPPICPVFTWVAEETVIFQWSRPEGQLFGYEITYDDKHGPYAPIDVFDRNSLQLERTVSGLTDGANTVVNISTLAGAGRTQTRSEHVSISPRTLGSAFNITTVTSTSISFGWYDLPDATSYDVCIQPMTGNSTCHNLTEKMTTFNDLTPGAAYTLFIGWDDACGVSRTLNTIPGSPVNTSLGSILSCAGQVTWDIPDGDYDFFEVIYMPDHGFTESPSHIYREDINENQTTVEFSFVGILPDTDYNVSVVTVSGALDVKSEPSYISFRTASPANGSVEVADLFSDEIQLMWSSDAQEYVYIRYNIDGEDEAMCDNSSLCSLGNGSESFNITDLESGQLYNIFVDRDGVCETLLQYTRPLSPVNVTTTESTLTSLVITWEDPGNETMFDQYYVAYERADMLGDFIEVGFFDPNVTWVTLEGLTPRTEYLVDVSTVVGVGDARELSEQDLHSAYTAAANGTVEVFEFDSTSMRLTWPETPSDHNVTVSITPDDGALALNLGNRSSDVTGLVPGRLYNISIFPFDVIHQRTIPLPPVNLSICSDVNATYFSICVTFTPPTGDFDAFNVFIRVGVDWPFGRRRKRSITPEGFELVETLASDTFETVLDGLTPNTDYVVKVVTVAGPDSETEQCSTAVLTRGRTSMIGENRVIFTEVNSTSFRVWWDHVSNYTGNYSITIQPDELEAQVWRYSDPYADFVGLSPSTVYNITVRTSSGVAAMGSVRTDPDSVSNLELTTIDEITLVATWDAPSVVSSSYNIQLMLSDGNETVRTVEVSGNVTEYTFECLTPNTTYTVELMSVLLGSGSFEDQVPTDAPLTATNTTDDLHPPTESKPTVYSLTSTSVAIRWGRLGQAGYSVCIVEYCQQDMVDPVCLNETSDLCSIEGVFDGLNPGELYLISFKDLLGEEELGRVRTRPAPPSSVTISAVNSRKIEIRWDPPPNIAEMVLEYFQTDDRTEDYWVGRIDNDGMYDIHGLDADTSYTVLLSSVGRPGAGDGSDDERLSGEPLEKEVMTSKSEMKSQTTL